MSNTTITTTLAKGCGYAVVGFLVCILVAFLLAWPEMLLWNCLMTKFFGLASISFWEMVGLNVFIRLLVPSIGVKTQE